MIRQAVASDSSCCRVCWGAVYSGGWCKAVAGAMAWLAGFDGWGFEMCV
jgi:hypothetical protein